MRSALRSFPTLQISSAKQLVNCNVAACKFSTSGILSGRKSRDPYDKRFGLHVNDAGPDKPGGSLELQEKLLRGPSMPQRPGVYSPDNKFHFVKEMVPEFVVPDLTGFKLKPYVSYAIKEIHQSEFTSEELFSGTYAKEILEDYSTKKIDLNTAVERIENLKKNLLPIEKKTYQ